ncbi:unnamed protein product [Sphagnum balticum]
MSERWFKNYRMEWIAESLRVYGFINREHIMTKFGLSVPQASKDLMEYQKLYPTAMRTQTTASNGPTGERRGGTERYGLEEAKRQHIGWLIR